MATYEIHSKHQRGQLGNKVKAWAKINSDILATANQLVTDGHTDELKNFGAKVQLVLDKVSKVFAEKKYTDLYDGFREEFDRMFEDNTVVTNAFKRIKEEALSQTPTLIGDPSISRRNFCASCGTTVVGVVTALTSKLMPKPPALEKAEVRLAAKLPEGTQAMVDALSNAHHGNPDYQKVVDVLKGARHLRKQDGAPMIVNEEAQELDVQIALIQEKLDAQKTLPTAEFPQKFASVLGLAIAAIGSVAAVVIATIGEEERNKVAAELLGKMNTAINDPVKNVAQSLESGIG